MTARVLIVDDDKDLCETLEAGLELRGLAGEGEADIALAARAELGAGEPSSAMIAFACAHPAKFPDAVERATGIRPALPSALGDLFERRERVTCLPNDFGAVTRFVSAHARRARNH